MSLPGRRQTHFIVVHCSATPPESDIGADEINSWHLDRGFDEIGYHAVIRRTGLIEFGRHFDVAGAHVRGSNFKSVGVCLVGGVDAYGEAENNFTAPQFKSLGAILILLSRAYPDAQVVGHRDLSRDINGDGVVTTDAFIKECPSFDVQEWIDEQN